MSKKKIKYKAAQEVVLGNISKIDVPEIKVRYNRSTRKKFLGKIKLSKDAADFIRKIYRRGEIELQEQFIVLYLNQANEILGYYRHSLGSINATVVDIRIILSTALKSAAVSMIIAHNHPSGNLTPSEADKKLTKKIRESAKLMELTLLDHIIVTKEGYYSFADDGIIGLSGLDGITTKKQYFVALVEDELEKGIKHNKRSIEKIAASYGITDKTDVKELTELAIVKKAREYAHSKDTDFIKYSKILQLYSRQVNLSHRTSQSILLQQYSTPAPIAYLAGLFTEIDKGKLAFEPSAGNGLLTIAGKTHHIIVNEIDNVRRANLKEQGYHYVSNLDASVPFSTMQKKFDAVITNPPFGVLGKPVMVDGFSIKVLDHLMAIYALDTMKDDGKAAIIIGGHTTWDDKGRITAGKNLLFFNYLYSRYNVSDVININGKKLYSRQGTSFDVRLILVDGRKAKISGAAPVRSTINDDEVTTFETLYERVMDARINRTQPKTKRQLEFEAEALALELGMEEELGAPYEPASKSCNVLQTVVPDSMSFETQDALEKIRIAVGGDIDEFVRIRLGYRSNTELCKSLSAEQIDAVAMAIYNIEVRRQAVIIGDQTGIGKGRIAASIVRYAVNEGLQPVVITEKANLFSDFYRDLYAIGSGHLVPFIVNGKESKTDIKDENGNIVFQALPPTEQNRIFRDKKVPARYDFVMATYSQFNSPEKKPEKPNFLSAISDDNIFILDESHNSSGSSNVGEFLQSVIAKTKGVTFLSATFAKRPDNMPIYAMKTAMSDANMTKDELIDAIYAGGVALQEILASQLVAEGQMLRRERSFEGVEVNYITLDEKEQEHKAISDNITEILREIIAFQKKYIDEQVNELDDIAVAEGKQVDLREGTSRAGVDNLPYFSKVFQVINQMLFSIKAESVADRAIARLKEGKKPVIAFASTMGSFIEQMENEAGLPVGNGDTINADFAEVLRRGLDGIMRYTETAPDGTKIFKKFEISDLPEQAQNEYYRIHERISSITSGISISPIDIVVQKIKQAGYRVAEVTGRKYEVQINTKTNKGIVLSRKKINTNDAFRQFNNNEVDVLMINQSGSTGASAHAIITDKVPANQVKQRAMIVLQAELDINTEVQKRGRINRTGQILKPIYDYVNSAIPAEKRLMMMLQKKLKSLDANTTSNQKQSTKILDVPDFLNKYGDKVVAEYLKENPEVNTLLDDPLRMGDSETESSEIMEDAAHKVSGRVAVLSTKMQQDFYNEISVRYNEYVEYLKQIGEYDLEVEAMDLQAEKISEKVIRVGKGGTSEFGDNSILETVRANVLKKPFSRTELLNLVNEALQGQDKLVQQELIREEFEQYAEARFKEDIQENEQYYARQIENIPNEKKVQKILKEQGETEWLEAIEARNSELSQAKGLSDLKIQKNAQSKRYYLNSLFNFFYVGKNLNYPYESYDKGQELVQAVFLGFIIDNKKKNPYAPSAIRLRFAIANSNKYIAIPASYSKDINAIQGVSATVRDYSLEDTLEHWEKAIKENNVDRKIRYIITGNLLQAFSDFKGKLVSYTTIDNTIKKGILMPEYWMQEEGGADQVSVPIIKAAKIIKSLTVGSSIVASNYIFLIRLPNNFRIIVPASRQKGGNVYLDKELLGHVDKNIFEKVSDKMVATFELPQIEKVIEILQKNHNANVSLKPHQYNMIKGDMTENQQRKRVFPKAEIRKDNKVKHLRLLELEAEALALELELDLAA